MRTQGAHGFGFIVSFGRSITNFSLTVHCNKITLKWDKPPSEHITFRKTEELLQALAQQMGGTYVPFPLWKGFANKKLISTHPLGGCRIARDRDSGTVNERGQLFDASKSDPKAVYDGLYVIDGSIVPDALGVNPTLTIAALALKIMQQVPV